ncbi:MAG: PAS domain S-box protein, partial [Proteobacteria bacterium]|nr:PAS domain S-box protein [Pseudomonadota bacterium]
EKRYFHQQGHIVWGQVSSSLVRDFQDAPLYFISHVQDITARKRAEEQLRESQEQFAVFMDKLPHGVFIKDKNHQVIYVNQYVKELFNAQNWLDKDAYAVFPEEIAQAMHADDDRSFSAGQTTVTEAMPDKHGIEHVFQTTKFRIERANKPPLLGAIGLDITERKRAEEAQQKLAHDPGERVKELNCLYGISHLVETPDISLEEILQGTVDLIPSAWQYPSVTCARIIHQEQEFKTTGFEQTIWKQAAGIVVSGERVGAVEICYREEKPGSDEGPFSKEERNLLNVIVERLGRIIERKRAEEALQQAKKEAETA